MTSRHHKLVNCMRRHGIKYPETTLREAQRTGLSLSMACALLFQESAGGQNVFGHDGVANPVKGGNVTRARYFLYKLYRRRGYGMQGVGPTQLTWYSYQDSADKIGGCWRPGPNMRVGFLHLAQLIHAYGVVAGCRAYNGAGPAAEAYSRSIRAMADHWHHIFNTEVPV